MSTETKGKKERTRPCIVEKAFPLQAAVFEFRNGDGRANYSIELTRTFRRDQESEWENTSYLTAQDLLSAARLLEKAHDAIQERLQSDYESRRNGNASDEPKAAIPF